MWNRDYLSQALVEVYVNYTWTSEALTGEDGTATVAVPYQTGLPITVVASKEGYIWMPLPYKTSRMPIFSSVTMSLLRLTQGNIWFFEDSVLITCKTSGASSQAIVTFSKNLLNLTDSRDITSIKAYLTIPALSSEDSSFLNTLGIMSTKSGYISVDLSPVAVVSVQLFSSDTELHVSGPIQISLSVPDSFRLQTSNVVPAWFFNRMTGGWMKKGHGMVLSVAGKHMWTFTAPHLGYWIAAPLSSNRDFLGFVEFVNFIVHRSSFLMVFLCGMLVVVTCLLVGLLYYHSFRCKTKTQKNHPATVMTKDQTTSTQDKELSEESSADSHVQDEDGEDIQHNSFVISMRNDMANHRSRHGLIQFDENAVAVVLECVAQEQSADPHDLMRLHKNPQQMKFTAEDLFYYKKSPVTILHSPAIFHVEEQPEQPKWSKSATLPRAGALNRAAGEPPSKDYVILTTQPTQNQAAETKEQLEVLEDSEEASCNTSWGHFGMPESVSVPGTLNQIGNNRRSCTGREHQGNSVHTLAELSKIPSPQPPRAWFVSLEGKPAAEIHYAVSEQHRRRRPVDSRETSFDSGVDMSEMNQAAGRRAVTLQRNATFVKSAPSSNH
ncbi:protein FAM171B-like isoform X2 [Thalassophryne amazonica]|uniref:protein FAM171B-like isoform X2 n=1 Tax=Thalassophryne amazonica TaxID=390379 RepID=UPI001470C698|nr:protein FAM171B-like isoform X2 [Thalassophryne amazonica]